MLTCFLFIALTSLCSREAVGQLESKSEADNLIDLDGALGDNPESFVNVSELKNLDIAQLLEINFVNKSMKNYQQKLQQVHSSLNDRVKSLIADVRGGSGSEAKFSPELKRKLNDSFLKFIESLELTPFCLASLNHLRMEISEKRLWPLKCKCKCTSKLTQSNKGICARFVITLLVL